MTTDNKPRIITSQEATVEFLLTETARLSEFIAAEPNRIAEAVTEADGEWSQGIADAVGEYPSNPSVARARITSIMAERIAAAERAAVVKALRDVSARGLNPRNVADAIESGADYA